MLIRSGMCGKGKTLHLTIKACRSFGAVIRGTRMMQPQNKVDTGLSRPGIAANFMLAESGRI